MRSVDGNHARLNKNCGKDDDKDSPLIGCIILKRKKCITNKEIKRKQYLDFSAKVLNKVQLIPKAHKCRRVKSKDEGVCSLSAPSAVDAEGVTHTFKWDPGCGRGLAPHSQPLK